MVKHGTLNVPVIGVAKSGWTVEQLRERARDSITKYGGGVDEEAFPNSASCSATSTATTRTTKPTRRCAPSWARRKLPPITWRFRRACSRSSSRDWRSQAAPQNARVILEKPFGRDLVSARKLNDTLHRGFS